MRRLVSDQDQWTHRAGSRGSLASFGCEQGGGSTASRVCSRADRSGTELRGEAFRGAKEPLSEAGGEACVPLERQGPRPRDRREAASGRAGV